MESLVDWTVHRARTTLTFWLILLTAGIIGYVTISKEADPDVDVPIILVSIPYPGISPADAERLIVKPLETRVKSIEGLKEMKGIASEGNASVVLEFDISFDKDQALINVREKVDEAKAEFPAGFEEPQVIEFNQGLLPVMFVTIAGDTPERVRLRAAQELQDVIEGVPMVLKAELQGQREEQLDVLIDPAQLEAYDVSANELISAVTLNNRLVAAGALDTGDGRFSVKVPGLLEDALDIASLVVKTNGDRVVTLGDIVEVRRTFKDAEGHARFNGEPAIAIKITKRLGENIIETTAAVREAVENHRQGWPVKMRESVRVGFALDQSTRIFDMLSQLEASVLTAVALVMIVVVAALGLRSATLVGIAIPSSFLMGIALLGLAGYTINMMVMFGMILAVGMLVDSAIVVTEYADRKMSEGISPRQAYARASKRMFWPIISSTLTTLAAFFPMLLWPGVVGEYMSYFPITLIFVMTAATLMALFFMPVLGGWIGKAHKASSETLRALAASEHGDLGKLKGITGAYVRTLSRIVRYPSLALIAALVMMFGIVAAFKDNNNGVEFFTATEPEYVIVFVSARGNLSIAEQRDLVYEVERRVLNVEGIKAFFTFTGAGAGGSPIGGPTEGPADAIGQFFIELANWQDRDRSGYEIQAEIREKLQGISGLRVEVRRQQDGPPTGKDIQIEIGGQDPQRLMAASALIRDHLLYQVDGLTEVEDTLPLPGIDWMLKVDREQAGRFGADISLIGGFVQLVTNGVLLGEYRPDDTEEEVEIRVRVPAAYRTLDQLRDMRLRTSQGLIPIGNFVSLVPARKVDQINRVDATQVFYVRANTVDGVLADDKVREVSAWLETVKLPDGVTTRFRGANEEQDESGAFLQYAGLMALALMFIILVTHFNSFYHAVLILSAVVMGTIGVLVGIMVTGQAFSVILTGTGIVALAGIVVNNNIVLIDTYHRLREDGFSPDEAIIRTGAQRLRPVMLTTITTIAGLLPMVLQISINFFERTVTIGSPTSLWWVQLSTAVVFGLAFSTVLTLFITPAAIALPHRIKEFGLWIAWLFRRKPVLAPAEAPAAAE